MCVVFVICISEVFANVLFIVNLSLVCRGVDCNYFFILLEREREIEKEDKEFYAHGDVCRSFRDTEFERVNFVKTVKSLQKRGQKEDHVQSIIAHL